ncbi:MAG: FecR domain-containing protein [Myxococcota bacterium]
MKARAFLAAVALLGILVMAVGVYGVVFPAKVVRREGLASEALPDSPRAVPAAPSPEPVVTHNAARATLRAVRGEVSVRSPAADWTAGLAGSSLEADQSVRTGEDGEAHLDFGRGIEVQVSPRSEFAVRELAENIARIRLDQGRLQAAVDPAAHRLLQVEAEGSDAVARSQGGRFGVVASRSGQLTVATEKGAVTLTAHGVDVDVTPGFSSTAGPDKQGPTVPAEIPKHLLLKLLPAAATRTKRRHIVVVGNTSPGALAYVDGTPVAVDSAGEFKLQVELQAGENRFSVNVLDAAGREASAVTDTIVLEQKRPAIETSVTWGSPPDSSP